MRGFTLIEILVVIGIVGLLAAIVLPVYSSSREKSRAASCASGLQQCMTSFKIYVQDNDEVWPDTNQWREWKNKAGNLPHCPSVRLPATEKMESIGHVPGYALNTAFSPRTIRGSIKDAEIVYPATTAALCEEAAGQATAYGPDPWKVMENRPPGVFKDWERHQGGANYAFCDGHVKWYTPDAVGYRGEEPNDGRKPTFEMFPAGHAKDNF